MPAPTYIRTTTIVGADALVARHREIPAGVFATVTLLGAGLSGLTYRDGSEVGLVTVNGALPLYSLDYNNLIVHGFVAVSFARD